MTNTMNMITLPAIDVATVLRNNRVKEATIDTILKDLDSKVKGGFVFNFGKHKGQTINEVYADPQTRGYLSWLAKELDGETEKFQDVKEALKTYV